jgi:hypothetical protein
MVGTKEHGIEVLMFFEECLNRADDKFFVRTEDDFLYILLQSTFIKSIFIALQPRLHLRLIGGKGDIGDIFIPLLHQVHGSIVSTETVIYLYIIGVYLRQVPIEQYHRHTILYQGADVILYTLGRCNDIAIHVPVAEHADEVARFVGIVISTAIDNFIAVFVGAILNKPGNGRKEGVRDILHHQPDNVRFTGAQAFGQGIGLIAHFIHEFLHALYQFLTDAFSCARPFRINEMVVLETFRWLAISTIESFFTCCLNKFKYKIISQTRWASRG